MGNTDVEGALLITNSVQEMTILSIGADLSVRPDARGTRRVALDAQ
jgi:hypothetical protein